jgi:hypothetical protein
MAKAVLEIVIVDDGGPLPVGAGAPPGSGFASGFQSPSERSSASMPGSVGEAVAAVAQVSGHGGFASVVLASTAALEKLTSAADKNRDALDAQARARIALPAPSSAGSLLQPPPLPGSATEFAQAPEGAGTFGATEAVGETAGVSAAAGSAAAGLAVFTAGVAVAGAGAVKLANIFEEQSRGLSRFSPELAIATANADINQMMAEIRRAQRIGPELAEFENERSRVMTQLYDIGTDILKVLLDATRFVGPLLEAMLGVLKDVVTAVKFVGEQVVAGFSVFGDKLPPGVQAAIDEAKKQLNRIATNTAPNDVDLPALADPFKREMENARKSIRGALPKRTLLPEGF